MFYVHTLNTQKIYKKIYDKEALFFVEKMISKMFQFDWNLYIFFLNTPQK